VSPQSFSEPSVQVQTAPLQAVPVGQTLPQAPQFFES
jgi:hypothetical protein